MLETPRSAIEDYCAQHDLQPRVDATNADTTYFRNRLRHELLPMLETYNPNIRSILRRTADVIAAEYEVLQAHTNFAWDMTVVDESDTAVTFNLPLWREQPIGVQRALLRKAIQQLRPPLRDIDFVHIEDAIEILQRATTGDQVTLPQNLLIEVELRHVHDLAARRTHPARLAAAARRTRVAADQRAGRHAAAGIALDRRKRPSRLAITAMCRLARFAACFDADTLPGPLALRPRTSADRFHPQGMPSPVRLKDWMINVKVPRAIRDRLPLLVSGDQIVWVPGFRVGQPFLVTEKTQHIIKLVFKKG